ncbi:MAG: 4'-phosphopantetheinyl transferase family protein [Sulfitobacter sp.]
MAASVDPIAQVQAAAATLFDGQIAVAVTDPKAPQPALMMSERDAVVGAIPARQREFAAGRAAARAAMVELGIKAKPILANPDRAPIWPRGVTGSISHTDNVCIAAVSHTETCRSLGIDIELATPLDADLITTICSDTELRRVAGPDQLHHAKLIFSAKEAAYKAQYSLSGLLFGFDHLDVTLDLATKSFVATFLKPAAPFDVGDTLPGRFVRVADHLVTAVTIGQDMPKGA